MELLDGEREAPRLFCLNMGVTRFALTPSTAIHRLHRIEIYYPCAGAAATLPRCVSILLYFSCIAFARVCLAYRIQFRIAYCFIYIVLGWKGSEASHPFVHKDFHQSKVSWGQESRLVACLMLKQRRQRFGVQRDMVSLQNPREQRHTQRVTKLISACDEQHVDIACKNQRH
jgi:hypothetical protein